MAHLGPGILTRYGHSFGNPYGAIDGAVHSVERAAAEILEAP
jgi:hypothetical protein